MSKGRSVMAALRPRQVSSSYAERTLMRGGAGANALCLAMAFCCLLASSHLFGQDTTEAETLPSIWEVADTLSESVETPVPRYDSSLIEPRLIDDDAMWGYLSDSEFDYARRYVPPESIIDRILSWPRKWLSDLLENNTSRTLLQYGVILAAFILVIYLLTRSDVGGILKRRSVRAENIEYEEVEEDIGAMNFELLIAEALKSGNLRRAVRLHYLKLLRAMTEGGLIEWRREKTNSQYIDELSRADLRPHFAELTRLFDYVWYGGFEIDPDQYDRIGRDFDGFTRTVEGAKG